MGSLIKMDRYLQFLFPPYKTYNICLKNNIISNCDEPVVKQRVTISIGCHKHDDIAMKHRLLMSQEHIKSFSLACSKKPCFQIVSFVKLYYGIEET